MATASQASRCPWAQKSGEEQFSKGMYASDPQGTCGGGTGLKVTPHTLPSHPRMGGSRRQWGKGELREPGEAGEDGGDGGVH